MKSKLLDENPRTYALVLDTGDEAVEMLTHFALDNGLSASSFTGLGGFSDAVLGFFDLERKEYERIPIREQVEVVSLVGDIALATGEPSVHPHVVVAKRDGTAHGGHLLEARVRPTLEVVITETPGHLKRRPDPATGLALIDIEV